MDQNDRLRRLQQKLEEGKEEIINISDLSHDGDFVETLGYLFDEYNALIKIIDEIIV